MSLTLTFVAYGQSRLITKALNVSESTTAEASLTCATYCLAQAVSTSGNSHYPGTVQPEFIQSAVYSLCSQKLISLQEKAIGKVCSTGAVGEFNVACTMTWGLTSVVKSQKVNCMSF